MDEKEYIEREAFRREIDEHRPGRSYEDAWALTILDSLPAADVRENKRGHWITDEEAERLGDYMLAQCCSVCHACEWDCTESESFHFCPNCGADMRAEPPKEG